MGLDKNSKKGCGCSGPTASDDIYKSNQIPVNTNYNNDNDKIIPVTISKEKNQYIVLEEDLLFGEREHENDVIPEQYITLPEKSTKNEKPKMDLITQFYIGSLTVVGLFVFYRLIQKTR